MFSLPTEFVVLLDAFRPLFSPSVWQWAQTLVMGAILCQGNRTVASCLRAVGLGNTPDFCKYHNVLRRARWSGLAAAKILFGLLIRLFVPPHAAIVIGADENQGYLPSDSSNRLLLGGLLRLITPEASWKSVNL